jgi:hypothetical protein
VRHVPLTRDLGGVPLIQHRVEDRVKSREVVQLDRASARSVSWF